MYRRTSNPRGPKGRLVVLMDQIAIPAVRYVVHFRCNPSMLLGHHRGARKNANHPLRLR